MAGARIRIRLLGGLEVRRTDGSVVEPAEFRTGKTADLLRILALTAGHPVTQASLLSRLWPEGPLDRAKGSLRSAASQIRHAVGTDCIVRQPGTLALQGAWVDVARFLADARAVHAAARTSRHSRALLLTRAAERLYRGDLRAYDDDSSWARAHRETLVRERQRMLSAGAACALALGLHGEARELAAIAVEVDGLSEGAVRTLMAAYGAEGEIASALRVYDTYRKKLADELGAYPSRHVRDLHVHLLRGEPPE